MSPRAALAPWALACVLTACSPAREKPAAAAPSVDAAATAPGPVAPPAPEEAAAPEPNPRAVGWDKLRLEDDVPLCVFADHARRNQADFLSDVRPQRLAADHSVVFGAFAPGCIAEACHAAPTLECWVDPGPEPATLVVHTRFSYEQKQGTACTQDCQPITAGCETAALKAGTYAVRYGRRSFPLRVPSVARQPCFALE